MLKEVITGLDKTLENKDATYKKLLSKQETVVAKEVSDLEKQIEEFEKRSKVLNGLKEN